MGASYLGRVGWSPAPSRRYTVQVAGEFAQGVHAAEPGSGGGDGGAQGVTLIVGGGFHGKSTLLRALERGVYNHVPGDGRELVVTDPTAVKIRAEDGRGWRELIYHRSSRGCQGAGHESVQHSECQRGDLASGKHYRGFGVGVQDTVAGRGLIGD